MKRPSISFNKEALLEWLLRHGEKIVVGIVGLAAIWMAWGGIDALQSKTVRSEQKPEAILRTGRTAEEHIDRETRPPADVTPAHVSLAKSIDPWRDTRVADATSLTLLDKPLFEELDKRTRPDVFPLEDLRAVAGIAVLASKDGTAEAAGSGARIAPYVVVTGLIPVAKQVAEYQRRFANVGFKDAKRDVPLWADYVVERAEVEKGGRETWSKIDLPARAARWKAAWGADSVGAIPPEFQFGADEEKRSPKANPAPYCGPLPPLAEGGWGLAAFHPWVAKHLRARAARGPGEGNEPAAVAAGRANPLEYRMFRFVDTEVEPGKSYRYRVRYELWNPNVNLPAQHLVDAATAKELKLPAPDSAPSAAVTIPDDTSILVGTKPKAELKRFKPGWLEVFVLAPSEETGRYALRGLITEVGGLADVNAKLNKTGDRRTRGDDIETGRLLVDLRGRQEERADPKATEPPEVLELLYLRPDGSFEFVSAADSEPLINRHKATLPTVDDGKPEPKPGQTDPATPAAPSPFGVSPSGQK